MSAFKLVSGKLVNWLNEHSKNLSCGTFVNGKLLSKFLEHVNDTSELTFVSDIDVNWLP